MRIRKESLRPEYDDRKKYHGITVSDRDCKHGHLARSCEICELEADCIRLQHEINCLRMEPCQLEHCVKERDALKAEVDRLTKEVAGTIIPHGARCLEMEKALAAESEVRRLKVKLAVNDDMRLKLHLDRDRWRTLAEGEKEALKNVKKHMEIVNPTGFLLSSCWRISDDALRAFEAGK